MLAPTDLPTVPVALRVHLAHATVQAIAEGAGADVLHIKGPSVDPELRPEGRTSADADVLVRPSHLARFQAGLKQHDWQLVKALRSGGLVQHSTNWYHGALGQMDVHVRFPGIQLSPEAAFEALWRHRGVRDIAHRPCTVPEDTAQRLVLLLHAARSRHHHRDDIRVAWAEASPTVQAEVSALAHELDADVALSVVTGHLEDFRDRPEYALWRLYADGATTTPGSRGSSPRSGPRPQASKGCPCGSPATPSVSWCTCRIDSRPNSDASPPAARSSTATWRS